MTTLVLQREVTCFQSLQRALASSCQSPTVLPKDRRPLFLSSTTHSPLLLHLLESHLMNALQLVHTCASSTSSFRSPFALLTYRLESLAAAPDKMNQPPSEQLLTSFTPSPTSIKDLPLELLRPIFVHLASATREDQNQRDLLACTLVCRDWYSPASYHLYQQIYIQSEPRAQGLLQAGLEQRRLADSTWS